MIAGPDNLLRHGAYTLDQAAFFAGIPSAQKARRWLFGSDRGERVLLPFSADDELISFIDFIQLRQLRRLRSRLDFPLQQLRETIETAHSYGMDFPFARRHQVYHFAGEIVVRVGDQWVGATGPHKHALHIQPVVAHPEADLGFDETGLASFFVAMRRGDRRVVLDPSKRLGAPIVEPCGYTVDSLVTAIDSEGSVARAARVFGVRVADVELAASYERSLSRPAA